MTRRSLLVAAGWFGAAVLAVLVGLAAISVIGAGLMSSDAKPRTEAEVAREAAGLPAPSARASLGSAPSAAPTVADRTLITEGGTVVARCVGGQAEIRSMSPVSGYAVHEREGDEGEFRSTSDNHDRVKFRVQCASGRPELSER